MNLWNEGIWTWKEFSNQLRAVVSVKDVNDRKQL